MKFTLPSDCGNSPRMQIVGDFISSWVKGETEGVAAWLADDVAWTVVGDDTYEGPGAAEKTGPSFVPERGEVTSIITHGRLASCDGYLECGSRRLDFSHSFRFASTSKTAKIAELRSFCIEK